MSEAEQNRVGSSPLTRGKPGRALHRRVQGGLIPAHAGKTLAASSKMGPARAHPRSRGENLYGKLAASLTGGSSPLTRGKHSSAIGLCRARGLIPAHAGKTRSYPRRSHRERAHPRSRGENLMASSFAFACSGSSPLTRGKRGAYWRDRVPGGLIPAHAGKTNSARSDARGIAAHPRSRGENLVGHVDWRRSERLIPAHAGKTWSSRTGSEWARAHPRSRGENPLTYPEDQRSRGSSPLTRGKLPVPSAARTCPGLIPAHAGKTRTAGGPPCPSRAHPRSRGENRHWVGSRTRREGSSPLTRGKHLRPVHRRRREGLIPAHAGKTPPPSAGLTGAWAHPRSRGENAIMAFTGVLMKGSSPLTRGKQGRGPRGCGGPGLIPAHAGKTACTPTGWRHPSAHPRSRGENRQ